MPDAHSHTSHQDDLISVVDVILEETLQMPQIKKLCLMKRMQFSTDVALIAIGIRYLDSTTDSLLLKFASQDCISGRFVLSEQASIGKSS
jgi:hypothetical protein